jgi:drug/metabolite transporter (DMT)-like permease
MLATLGAATCAAAGTVIVRSQLGKYHPVALNAAGMIFGGLVISSIAILSGENFRLPRTTPGVLSVVYLAIFGSVVGFLLYFWLLRRWPVARTALVISLLPLLAVLIGIVFLGERIRPETVVGGVMVVVGVYLASR